MRNLGKLFIAVFALTALCGFVAIAAEEAAKPEAAKEAAKADAGAKDWTAHIKLWKTKCKKCHGLDGAGVQKMTKPLKVDLAKLSVLTDVSKAKSSEELLKLIVDGKEKMPAYKKKLTEEQNKMMLDYTLHLQGR